MDKLTQLLHCKVDDKNASPVVTPIYQNSAFRSESPYFYTRKDNPNTKELENLFSILEDAPFSVVATTGMSAIYLTLNLLKPNSTLLINKDIYGCSYKLFQKFSDQFNIKLLIIDLSIKENIDNLRGHIDLVFFETPTNPFLKTIDIKYVSDKIKNINPNSLIVVDNTWATPIYQLPLKFGADISLYSATKYFSGHSDVMGGMILTNSELLYTKLKELRFYSGAILAPQSAWLLRRSMQTFAIRMKEHNSTTLIVKNFLMKCKQVEKVYYPFIDGNQLKGYGTLIFFDLRSDLVEKYPLFANTLKLFDTGTGMACVTSMVAQPYSGSHASMSDSEKAEMNLSKKLIRLSFGLETPSDLIQDLKNAFEEIDN
jgi:cystathionine beta-lyase/cystathionine gamma-synthase